MLDRARIIDENFINKVSAGALPPPRSSVSIQQAGLNGATVLDLFNSQIKSRHLDLQARKLKAAQQGFYTIGSSGHEGNAVIGKVFRYTDLAFLHYRSGALFIQRAKQLPEIDPVKAILLSLVASREDPIAQGRHKVFGSVPLFIPPQTSTIASHLPKAVGAALSITRAKELQIQRSLADDSVILCSLGDASINHASALASINAAEWIAHAAYPLPLVFICEDNGIGISVPTPTDWIQTVMQRYREISYIQADSLHIPDLYQAAKKAEQIARINKKPVFLHMKCLRLMGHAGSDIESQYLAEQTIIANEFNDPLLHTARIILENNWLSSEELVKAYQTVRQEIEALTKQVIASPKLQTAFEVMQSICPQPKKAPNQPQLNYKQRKLFFSQHKIALPLKRDLGRQINITLIDLMCQYDNVVVLGEDVGKKGGVYRVTARLQEIFGRRRVFDTLLDETTILGTAIGLAHNGFLPIPEIQFLAYLHNAEDQLRGEAATLPFFSSGQYANPLVLRLPSLAYQQGFGGHFHNDNSLAVLRDIPGLVIACPSNGRDAALLLRECVRLAQEQARITVFIEPIALYMTKDLHQTGDQAWLFNLPNLEDRISLGEIRVYGAQSADLAIISYGNGYYLSRQAEAILRTQYGKSIKVIDLCWLAPLSQAAIIKAVKNCRAVVIVDECRITGSLSETLVSLLVEHLDPLPKIKRLAGKDCFIPLGKAAQLVLPSRDDIVHMILTLSK